MSSQKRKYELKARAERQRRTRERIVEATVALHQEVGPAQTTVSEIARRAGVERLTVYNHFPEQEELFAACQSHFLARHPAPDFAAALAVRDPRARVQAALGTLYASYRDREPMTGKVVRDRSSLPALDALLGRTMDVQLAELGKALAEPFRARGARARRLNAVIAVALDFSTWWRLKDGGLDDEAAAELMAGAVGVVFDLDPTPKRGRPGRRAAARG